MRVWITRTRPGADRTAERVQALGHAPVTAPVLEVRRLSPDLDLGGVAALAFTSANGADAFAALSPRRDLPVYAVGAATARAARTAGFTDVRVAAGDVARLGDLVALTRPAGAVLHAAGEPRAGDLEGALARVGVEARTVVVYETRPAPPAPPPACEAALVHSPHAARVLAERLDPRTAPALLCLSPAVAAPLAAAGFARLRPAPEPTDDALLALLPPPTLAPAP